MFARISSLFLFVLFALPLLAAATAVPRNDAPPAPSCSTGTQECCNSTQDATNLSGPVSLLLGLLGVVVGDLTGLVGLTCTSVLSGGTCTAQNVCCTGNNFEGGLVVIGCSPINIGL